MLRAAYLQLKSQETRVVTQVITERIVSVEVYRLFIRKIRPFVPSASSHVVKVLP